MNTRYGDRAFSAFYGRTLLFITSGTTDAMTTKITLDDENMTSTSHEYFTYTHTFYIHLFDKYRLKMQLYAYS